MHRPLASLALLAAVSGLGCASVTRPHRATAVRDAAHATDPFAPAALTCRTSRSASLATTDTVLPLMGASAVRWISTYDARERAALDRWCAGVGPAVVTGALESGAAVTTTIVNADATRTVVMDSIDTEVLVDDSGHVDESKVSDASPDTVESVSGDAVELPVVTAPVAGSSVANSLVVVTWNTHVGGADIAGLVRDLREGKLTNGERVEHFVLLLQEVHRASADVPFGVRASVPRPIHTLPHTPGANRVDIVETARALGVQLFYVPSMANGRTTDGLPEDRGNAILSTLPLRDLVAIELPYEAQRRVAAAATVSGVDAEGTPWSLRLVNVHLDNKSRVSRLLQSLGGARTRQAKALVRALGEEQAIVVGGDVNTWGLSFMEGTDEVLRRQFPLPHKQPTEPTFQSAGLRLDRLMFRLPASHEVETRRLADRRGSDHHPLIGVVKFR